MAICQGPVANLFFATGPFLAEMEGFEPPHALRRLPDFELYEQRVAGRY